MTKSEPFPSAKTTRATAISLAFATWILLLVGCMVHGTGSSLACPDWPTCFGTFFPEMKGGVVYEHSHRLVAASVGLITFALTFMLWRRRERDSHGKTSFKLGLLASFLVCVQGTLGGITVKFKLPIGVTLAHLATSMCFFCLVTYLAMRTAPKVPEKAPSELSKLRVFAAITSLAALGQIVLGGVVRHTHNGMACFTLPLCDGGEAWPELVGRKIQMGHRYAAVALGCMVIAFAIAVWRKSLGFPRYRRLAFASIVLVLTQIGLGLASVGYGLPLAVVTLHLGVAALILVTQVALFATIPGAATVHAHAPVGDPALAGGE